MSVPNQKIITISKPKYTDHFLQIGISEWQNAQQQMNYSTFCLYLFLAGNKNGFHLELSKEAFANATGFKKTAYHDAIKKLVDLGYLTWNHGNVWNFHTTPDLSGGSRFNEQNIPQKRITSSASPSQPIRPTNTEIDNIDNNKYKIDTASSKVSLQKSVSELEIKMYRNLDKLFLYPIYSEDDSERISELLQNEYYWDNPQERIAAMTDAERKSMTKYYEKYSEYMLEDM